jgi:predicted nucleic acid-binding protein
MSLLVDSCVWSEAYRKNGSPTAKVILAEILRNNTGSLIGAVRQEVLTGVKSERQYVSLRDVLREFENVEVNAEDHEIAAMLSNKCQSVGLQGSHVDFLLCAVAIRLDLPILTYDKDFQRFAKHIPIRLFRV